MEKEILLSSGLTQDAFGKTNLGAMINEKGLIFDVGSSAGSATPVPEFIEGWTFEKTFLGDDGLIYFSGNVALFEGDDIFSLSDILDKGYKNDDDGAELKRLSVLTLADFLTNCISTGESVPAVGFGGVYFVASLTSATSEIKKIIFLPEEIFSRCASCQDEKTKARLIGKSAKSGLKGKGAAAFLRAASIYKLLTKKDAYTNENENDRHIDMLDGLFIPTLVAVSGISEKLASAIDSGLKINADFVKKSKKTLEMEKAAIEKFPLDELHSLDMEKIKSADPISILAFEKKLNRVISVNRFCRRNKNGILVALAVIFVGFYVFNSFYKSNLALASSVGCTPQETAKILYQGINDADVTITQEVAKGRKIKDLETMLVGIRVNYKSHQAMEENGGNLTPSEWLAKKGTSNFWIYGITNLEIDGEKVELTGDYPRRKEKRPPIAAPTENDTATTHSKYFLVHSESDYRINVIENNETLTLKWKKNRWIITEIESKATQKMYETKKLKEDYIKALEENDDDVALATESLRIKYNWLPNY